MPKLGRYQANCLIMAKLQRLVDKWPEQRFHQILQNIGVIEAGTDQFYEESMETLVKLIKFEDSLERIAKE